MTGLSDEAIMRLLARSVPAIARRAVRVPSVRLASVDRTSDPTVAYVAVLVDGDDDAISVLNGTGGPLVQGQRVVVSFYPPHGALVVGVLTPAFHLEQLWTTSYDVASSATVSTVNTAWTLLTPGGFGWHDNGNDLECDVGGLWELTLHGGWSSSGAGEHRGASLMDGDGTRRVSVSHQFATPGGAPTSGYGLASSGLDVGDFEAGDTLNASCRQDTGGDLAVRLLARLRLLGPSA